MNEGTDEYAAPTPRPELNGSATPLPDGDAPPPQKDEDGEGAKAEEGADGLCVYACGRFLASPGRG